MHVLWAWETRCKAASQLIISLGQIIWPSLSHTSPSLSLSLTHTLSYFSNIIFQIIFYFFQWSSFQRFSRQHLSDLKRHWRKSGRFRLQIVEPLNKFFLSLSLSIFSHSLSFVFKLLNPWTDYVYFCLFFSLKASLSLSLSLVFKLLNLWTDNVLNVFLSICLSVFISVCMQFD